MKSETRANLIFLIVLAVLTLPGAVILAWKNFKPGYHDLSPPRVREALAYMDPMLSVGAHLPAAPPLVGRYVMRLGNHLADMQPGLNSIVSDFEKPGVMSERYTLQLLGTGVDRGSYRVALLGWDAQFTPLPTQYTFTGTRAGGSPIAGAMNEYEMQNFPLDLREELQTYGFIKPPESTTWILVTFPGTEPIEQLHMVYTFEGKTIEDTLDLRKATPATRPAS